MTSARIATITLKTSRPREVARFWRDLLAYEVAPNHSHSVLLVGAPDEPALLIQPSEQDVGQGAMHLDLRPEDFDTCRDRALALGASLADIGQTGEEGWLVMADPGGTLFCILRPGEDDVALGPGTPTPLD